MKCAALVAGIVFTHCAWGCNADSQKPIHIVGEVPRLALEERDFAYHLSQIATDSGGPVACVVTSNSTDRTLVLRARSAYRLGFKGVAKDLLDHLADDSVRAWVNRVATNLAAYGLETK